MLKNTRVLVYCAVLIAISIALSLIAPFLTTFRINLAPVFVMFAGAAFGPLAGMAVGAITDVAHCLIMPQGPYFPGFTITMALYGLLAALFFYKKQPGTAGTILVVVLIQTICSTLLNTFWMMIVADWTFAHSLAIRIAPSYIMCAIYVVLMPILMRYKSKLLAGVQLAKAS